MEFPNQREIKEIGFVCWGRKRDKAKEVKMKDKINRGWRGGSVLRSNGCSFGGQSLNLSSHKMAHKGL